MLIRRSREHLKDAQKTYAEHGSFALRAGVLLIWAGVTSLVHGIVPAFFPFLSSRITLKLAAQSRENRTVPDSHDAL
ncbi:MAG: DUF6356 family protein [Candidatus Melainabacteria bacterium]